MILTSVFMVIILQAGESPVYGILGEVPEVPGKTAFENCIALIPTLPKEKQPNLSCVEVVQHGKDKKPITKHLNPENSRRMGNVTKWGIGDD